MTETLRATMVGVTTPSRQRPRGRAAPGIVMTLAIAALVVCPPDGAQGSERSGFDTADVIEVAGADPTGAIPSTRSIQLALDDATERGGGTVVVPAGVFVVDRSLRIGSGVTLRGAGRRSTILRTSGCEHLLMNADTKNGNTGVRIEGLALEGSFDGTASGSCGQQLIRLMRVDDLTIRDVELSRSGENGLVIGRGCARVTIEDVHSHDNGGIGFYVQNVRSEADGEIVTFLGCVAEGNGSSGFAAFASRFIGYHRCQASGNGRLARDGAGFNLDNSHVVAYRGCVARGNGVGFGSYSWSSGDDGRSAAEELVYEGCLAEANRDRGFLFQSPRRVGMTGCDAVANGRGGIGVAPPDAGDGPTLSVVGGAVRGNVGRGIESYRPEAVVTLGVTIEGNGRRVAQGRDRGASDDLETGVEPVVPVRGPAVGMHGEGLPCPSLWSWSDESVVELAVAGDRAYLATEIGLVVLDVSDPGAPVEIGRLPTPSSGKAVAVVGNRAYFTTETTLMVIGIGQPSAPVVIGTMATQGTVVAIAVDGSVLCLAAGDDGLRIVDVTDPTLPVEIGAVADSWEARDVVIRDEFAYVAAGWSGLRIVEISDPTNPVEIGASGTRRAANGVDLAGGYAFLAVTKRVAVVVNVKNPHAPFMVRLYESWGISDAIAVGAGYAHVASRNGFVTTFDISLPTQLSQVGVVDIPGSAVGIALKGGDLLVADSAEGLAVVRLCTLFSDSFESRSTGGWGAAVP